MNVFYKNTKSAFVGKLKKTLVYSSQNIVQDYNFEPMEVDHILCNLLLTKIDGKQATYKSNDCLSFVENRRKNI